MTSRPLWGNVLVRLVKADRKTKSGIELPNASQQGNLLRGTIISWGENSLAMDGTRIEMEKNLQKPSTLVEFKKHEAYTTTIDGEELYIVDQRQIVQILYP